MNNAGGWSTIAGWSSSGLRPNGCVPTAVFSNGLEAALSTIREVNTAPTAQRTMTAPATSRCTLPRSSSAMTTATIAMSSSQRRNDPCWPAQNPAMR